MAGQRRPIEIALFSLALCCSTLSLLSYLDVVDVPAGRFLGAASWFLVSAALFYRGMARSRRTHEPSD